MNSSRTKAPWCVSALFLMLIALACRDASAERLELPTTLNALLQNGAFVETGGMRYSGFALVPAGSEFVDDGVQQSQRTVVKSLSSNGFSGLGLQMGDNGYSASGPSQLRKWGVAFTIEPLTVTPIGLVRLSAMTAANGNAVALISYSIHDERNVVFPARPLEMSVDSIGVTSDSSSFPVIESLPGINRAGAFLDMALWSQGSNASATMDGVALRVRNYAESPLDGDYDYDNDVDGGDFLVWQRQFGASKSLDADGNFDGKVDAADFTIWRDNFGTQIGPPGDFDGDGDVDGNDFLTWQRAFGTNNPAADANEDGIVDAADYTVWRDNFGVTSGPGTVHPSNSTVPEPASLQLSALALGLASVARQRR